MIEELHGCLRVPVEVPASPYDVWIGSGAVKRLDDLLPKGSARVAVVTQPTIAVDVADYVGDREVGVFTIGDGEEAKSLGTIERLCSDFSRWGLTRGDVVVGVGGGVVTDVAGFAAAVYHRGVKVAHVATSLLGMVDAAVGGKTGVNLPEGKNLVGAFWQPVGVVCDTDHLATLPERERRCGLGEVAKYHFLGGDGLDSLATDLAPTVARCVEIKAAMVVGDEREAGRRALLNYGHTLGHALETEGGYDLRHGEAVAIGLVYAACLAHRLGRIGRERVDEHVAVVSAYGLPTSIPPGRDLDVLVRLLRRDKKAVAGLTFVLDGPNGVEVVAGVDQTVARIALDDVVHGGG